MIRHSCLLLLAALAASPACAASGFQAPDGSELSKAIERQFVRAMMPDASSIESIPYEWMSGDVDGDDYDELFIKLTSKDLCTTSDCPIVGFIRIGDGSWRPILTAVGDTIAINEGEVEVSTAQGVTPYVFDPEAMALVPHQDR